MYVFLFYLCRNLSDIVQFKDAEGNTPLHVAVQCNDLTATRMLLLNTTDTAHFNVKNNDGKTPLCITAAERDTQKDIVQALIRAGVDIELKCNEQTAFQAAIQSRNSHATIFVSPK